MNFDAPIFTSQGDISEIGVFSQIPKGCVDIFLKIIPLKTEFFVHGSEYVGHVNNLIFEKLFVKICALLLEEIFIDT